MTEESHVESAPTPIGEPWGLVWRRKDDGTRGWYRRSAHHLDGVDLPPYLLLSMVDAVLMAHMMNLTMTISIYTMEAHPWKGTEDDPPWRGDPLPKWGIVRAFCQGAYEADTRVVKNWAADGKGLLLFDDADDAEWWIHEHEKKVQDSLPVREVFEVHPYVPGLLFCPWRDLRRIRQLEREIQVER
jgi:hypothetical protein